MTPLRKYTYPDGNQNMGTSNVHFTVSGPLHHELFTWTSRASCLLASICWLVVGKWNLLEFVAGFCEFLESYECRTKCNWSLGMEYNGKLYGFSAVKVKLVDSLIWRPFILSGIRPREPMTGSIWHLCEFLFWTIRSLNFHTLMTLCVTIATNLTDGLLLNYTRIGSAFKATSWSTNDDITDAHISATINRFWPNFQQLLVMSNKGKLVNFSSFAHR